MMSGFVVNGPSAGPRALAVNRGLTLHLMGITALALVLVASDAFGSDDLSLGRRILMFGVVSTLLVVQASVLAVTARRVVSPSFLGRAGAAASAVAATLALMTLEIHVLKATPIVPYTPDPLPEFALFLTPFVVPVSALVLGLRWSARREFPSAPSPAGPSRAEPTQPDRARMTIGAGDAMHDWPRSAILRVQAFDHYLELRTSQETRLVRGRMRDALRRLPAAEGVQPHRSWWIHRSEIVRIERRGRDHILLLGNGDRVPVARSRTAEVKRFLRNENGPCAELVAPLSCD